MDEELVHETDNKATSPGDQNGIGDGTPHEQEQSTLTKDPLPSEVTLAKMRALFSRGNVSEAGALAYTYARQSGKKESNLRERPRRIRGMRIQLITKKKMMMRNLRKKNKLRWNQTKSLQ